MNLLSALFLLFIVQTPQDDYEKWERENLTPTKERIETALKSGAKREWWEGEYNRAGNPLRPGDRLIVCNGEYYNELHRSQLIGKAAFANGRLTLTSKSTSEQLPWTREYKYVPVRWGAAILLLADNEYELLRFCNDYNSGDLPWMTIYFATSHKELSLSEVPDLPEAFRNKLLKAPLEYQISEVVQQQGLHSVEALAKDSVNGARVKIKFTEKSRPYLGMQVFADKPYLAQRGWVVAIGDDEGEIVLEKWGVHPEMTVGEKVSTKKPIQILNEQVWWQTFAFGAVRIRFLGGVDSIITHGEKGPSNAELLRWFSDDLRWIAAHCILVGRHTPKPQFDCQPISDGYKLNYEGLKLTLTYDFKNRPKDAEGDVLFTPNYSDVKGQQAMLREFWKSKLAADKLKGDSNP